MTKEMTRYQTDGFVPVNDPPARIHMLADTDTIVKGDVLHDDGNGKATNVVAVLDSALFLGVAAANCDNSGDDDLKVEMYPFDPRTRYIVPVAAPAAAITQTAVGLNVHLQSNDDIDIGDAVTTGMSFKIDGIDISDRAIAANTYGYALGKFALIVTEG